MRDMRIQKKYRRPVEEFVKKALERYKDKIDSIILFGSVARGEAREDSTKKSKCSLFMFFAE